MCVYTYAYTHKHTATCKVCVYMYVSICLTVCVCVFLLFVYGYLSVYSYSCLYISSYVLSVSLSIYLLSIVLSFCLWIYPSVHLPISSYLSIYLYNVLFQAEFHTVYAILNRKQQLLLPLSPVSRIISSPASTRGILWKVSEQFKKTKAFLPPKDSLDESSSYWRWVCSTCRIIPGATDDPFSDPEGGN